MSNQHTADLVAKLKLLEAEPDKIRQRRAMFLALANAFSTPFLTDRSTAQMLEFATEEFKHLLYGVNEYVSVDTKLALHYHAHFFTLRDRLIRGDLSAPLIQAYFDEVSEAGSEFSVVDSEHLSAITASSAYRAFCRERRMNLEVIRNPSTVQAEPTPSDVN